MTFSRRPVTPHNRGRVGSARAGGNPAPPSGTVTITSPTGGATRFAGVAQNVEGTATGSVTSVEVFWNAVSIGTAPVVAGNWSLSWSPSFASVGSFSLTATGSPGGIAAAPVAITAWSPALISSVGKYFWGDVDLGYTTATGVDSWTDQFGLNNPTQATSGNQPLVTLASPAFDGHGFMTFDAISKSLVFAGLDLPAPNVTPLFGYAILRQTGWTSGNSLFAAQLNSMMLQQNSASPSVRMNNASGVNLNNGGTLNTVMHVQFLFTGSTSDYLRIGTTTTTGASAGTNDPTTGLFTIGARAGGLAGYVAMDLAAFLLLAGEPTEIALARSFHQARYPTATGP